MDYWTKRLDQVNRREITNCRYNPLKIYNSPLITIAPQTDSDVMLKYLKDFHIVVILRNAALEEAELQFLHHDVVGCVFCNIDLECLVVG